MLDEIVSTEEQTLTVEKKPIGYTKDGLGDKSSKRLTAFILLGFYVFIGIFAVVFDGVVGFKSVELVKYLTTTSLVGTLTALGLTIPEQFSKK